MQADGQLRLRATGQQAAAAESVQPLDSSEQDRIIREFALEKARQDRLWKHFLALLYGFSALLLSLIASCSLLFGCDARAASPLDEGPACRYFILPSLLVEATRSKLATQLTLIFALTLVGVWGAYAYFLNEAEAQLAFSEKRGVSRSGKIDVRKQLDLLKSAQQAAASSGRQADLVSAAALPFSKASTVRALSLLRRLAHSGALAWSLLSGMLVWSRWSEMGPVMLLFLAGPLLLAGMTKLAAKWSHDLEAQIDELKRCKYEYHEL